MTRHAHLKPLTAGDRWLVWLLVQALLALALTAAPRAMNGPLHWHEAASDHHGQASGQWDRHWHVATDLSTEATAVDAHAPLAEDLGSIAGAVLVWPAIQTSVLRLPSVAQSWALVHPPSRWQDADAAALERPPRV